MDLSEVTQDQAFSEYVQILRSVGGVQGLGGWQEPPPQAIDSWGTVTPATAKSIQTVPEADRVEGAILYYTNRPLFTTHTDPSGLTQGGTSDILVWRGQKWRVIQTWPYGPRGFYYAYAGRMAGS